MLFRMGDSYHIIIAAREDSMRRRPAPIVSLTLRFLGHFPSRPPASAVARMEGERTSSAPPQAYPRELTVKWAAIRMTKPQNPDVEPNPRINSQSWAYPLQTDRSLFEISPIIRKFWAYPLQSERYPFEHNPIIRKTWAYSRPPDENLQSSISRSRTTQATPTKLKVRKCHFENSIVRYIKPHTKNNIDPYEYWWKATLTLSPERTKTD